MVKPNEMKHIVCHGCGALVENSPGQPHEYIGASQGCWNIYTEILAREYGAYNYPQPTHRLTVDTYAIQHPGQPNRKSIQSVNIHLISLYLIFEMNMTGKETTQKMTEILSDKISFNWLEPPIRNGYMTVKNVLGSKNQIEHEQRVLAWSKSVWGCWYEIHGITIKNIVDRLF